LQEVGVDSEIGEVAGRRLDLIAPAVFMFHVVQLANHLRQQRPGQPFGLYKP